MKSKIYLLVSLFVATVSASAQVADGDYVVKNAETGKYIKVVSATSERNSDGTFAGLTLTETASGANIVTITNNGAEITSNGISATQVIAKASNLGNDAKFSIIDNGDGTYKAKGESSIGVVYLTDMGTGAGTKGANKNWVLEKVLVGDANGDEVVDINDYVRILRKTASEPVDINVVNADNDKNGAISVADLPGIIDAINAAQGK